MNDPYPGKLQLRVEFIASAFLVTHNKSTEAYHRLVDQFLADFVRLEFPLGSPSLHYDWDEIWAFMSDSKKPQNNLEDAAMDKALGQEMAA